MEFRQGIGSCPANRHSWQAVGEVCFFLLGHRFSQRNTDVQAELSENLCLSCKAVSHYSFSDKLLVSFLDQTSPFPGAVAQEIEFGATHLGMAHHFDLLHTWRIDHESSLDADTVRSDTTYRDTAVHATAAQPNNGALEYLHALIASFHDAVMHTYCIARPQFHDLAITACGNLLFFY